jgi:hypothetical protein
MRVRIAHGLVTGVLPALLLAGPGAAAPPPTPAATLRLPSADDDQPTGPVWVGFDPAGRYLAAYQVPSPRPDRAYLTVWEAAGGRVVHDATIKSAASAPEFGPPAAFLPSGSHLIYLTAAAARGHPLGAARGELAAYGPPDKLREWAAGFAASAWTGPGAEGLTRLSVDRDWTVTAWGPARSGRRGSPSGTRSSCRRSRPPWR